MKLKKECKIKFYGFTIEPIILTILTLVYLWPEGRIPNIGVLIAFFSLFSIYLVVFFTLIKMELDSQKNIINNNKFIEATFLEYKEVCGPEESTTEHYLFFGKEDQERHVYSLVGMTMRKWLASEYIYSVGETDKLYIDPYNQKRF